MWYYDSPVGRFVILKANDGRYALVHDDIIYDLNANPAILADNFYSHATGCGAWDALSPQSCDPLDLDGWSKD